MTKSPEAQALLDEMRPLGKWLADHQKINRVLGRTAYAKEHGDDALRELDKEWNEKYSRFTKLSRKYHTLRMKEMRNER